MFIAQLDPTIDQTDEHISVFEDEFDNTITAFEYSSYQWPAQAVAAPGTVDAQMDIQPLSTPPYADVNTANDGQLATNMDHPYEENLGPEMTAADFYQGYNHTSMATAAAVQAALDSFDYNDEHDTVMTGLTDAQPDHFIGSEYHHAQQPALNIDGTNSHISNDMQHVTAHLQALQEYQATGVAPEYDGMNTAQINLNLDELLRVWSRLLLQAEQQDRRQGINTRTTRSVPNVDALVKLRKSTFALKQISRTDLNLEHCDLQGIDWHDLGVTRNEARRLRSRTYNSYTNLVPERNHAQMLRQYQIDASQSYFKFRRLNLAHKPHFAHFQLRNMLAYTSQNSIYYAGRNKVYQSKPLFKTRHKAMDLTDSYINPGSSDPEHGISIATLAADLGVLVVGGYAGEYALRAINTGDEKHIEGIVSNSQENPLVNHIDIIPSRTSHIPQAVFSCNDKGLRVLDTKTQQFAHEHSFDWAINGSTTSPDSRLRAIVGDDKNVLILNAETSEVLQNLVGHHDYGFACAWADNGYHVATSNQDELIKIWDARMWTDATGLGKPIKTISAQLSCVRNLRFSPVGSGKRVLLAAEQADVVNIIDAQTYDTKQELDFFGEILGANFSPDGKSIAVGIHDSLRGGIMEFERCGLAENAKDGLRGYRGTKRSHEGDHESRWHVNAAGSPSPLNPMTPEAVMDQGLDWKPSLQESVAHPKAKRTVS